MGIDQAPAGEIVTAAVKDAPGVVSLGAPARAWLARKQSPAGGRITLTGFVVAIAGGPVSRR